MTRSKSVVLVAILLVSCGKEGPSDPSAGATESTAPTAPSESKADRPAATVTEDAAATPALTDSAAAMPATADTDMDTDTAENSASDARDEVFGFEMNSFDFLGWTADGSYFVLAATHRDQPGEGVQMWRVELNQVHDALTGKVVDSYRIASDFPKAGEVTDYWPEKQVRAAWKQAKPRAEWKSWLAAHPLVKNDPTTSAKGWKISAKLVASSVRKEHKFAIEVRPKGFYSHWDLVHAEHNWDDPKIARLMKLKPRIALSTSKGAESWKSITYHVPFNAAANNDDTYGLMGIGRESWKDGAIVAEPVTITGSMRPFWSPQGDRIVWAMYHSFAGVPKRLRAELSIAHFYIRTPGPQIRLVDAGIGDKQARGEVARLAAAGLPITVLGTARQPAAASEIYYRGRGGQAIARRLVEVLGSELPTKELKKPGYLDVVIVLAR